MKSLLKKPSAWVPIAASLAVFAVMLITISTFGIPTRQPDEGTGAHLFQIWLALEALLITVFAVKWLPQRPTQAVLVIAIQAVSALLPMSVVFLFHL
jgi:hypothetical protein